ncbi:MAG: TonB-dependent receptor [Scytonematopsis contorta HA4267-MV1]|jgi:iron complex outermembrane receptor protein|nr:TonB-dependent receptor [Scytonematopsis contorta HA4267-MV1]
MKLDKLFQSLLLTGAVITFISSSALAEEVREDVPSDSPKSVDMLVQASSPNSAPLQEVVPITSVKANPTNKGLEVILQTTKGNQLQVTNRSTGNNFIADITGAQLRLGNGGSFVFRSSKPIAGITDITITNFDANTVRVTVIGEAGLPTVELFDDDEGLIFGIAPVATATPQPGTQQKPELEKPASETPQEKPSAEGDEPIELVVTGQQDNYRVPDATVGTRTNTPLRDIPQSIQVVPRQVIEDQQVTRLNDILQNIPGVISNSSSREQFDTFFIRGFGGSSNTGNLTRRNGLKDPFSVYRATETANIERVEVLKGPASVLFGQGTPGGMVNIVTKRPLSQPFYQVEATAGNYDFYRGAIDLSGPLNQSGTLLYRLNAAAETSESFVDFFDRQRYFVAPVVSWQLSKNTRLTFNLEYTEISQQGDFGLPALGTVLNNPNGKIPLNRYIGEPSLDRGEYQGFRVGYDFEHKFSENWQIRNAFQTGISLGKELNIFPLALSSDNRTLERGYFDSRQGFNIYTYLIDTYVVGKFNTGDIKHELVFGFDLYREKTVTNDGIFNSLDPLDLFEPNYGRASLAQAPVQFDNVDRRDSLGIYVQDQITLADNFKLLLGGRFDLFNQTNEDFIANTETFQQDNAFSPRIGIVYQPVPAISLYASYARSTQQVTGRSFANALFKPEKGTQYEIGIKAELSDRLSGTLALYDLTRSNVLTTDSVNPTFSIQTGKQKSHGVELDVSGEILPGWNVIAGYAYTYARITEDNTYEKGNLLNNIPKHSFNLWTTYEIQSGNFKGLGFGLGLYYIGDRQGDLNNSFKLPSYLRTDAAIFYKQDRFRASLNIKNLFDVDYFRYSQDSLRVFPGDPLTVQGTISWQF